MERTHATPAERCAVLFFIQPKVFRALRCLSYIKLKPLVLGSNSKVLKMLLLADPGWLLLRLLLIQNIQSGTLTVCARDLLLMLMPVLL